MHKLIFCRLVALKETKFVKSAAAGKLFPTFANRLRPYMAISLLFILSALTPLITYNNRAYKL